MPITVQAALQGVVQGLTEFLPVSSSAHLILARAFFGFDGEKFGLPFDVACHVGTLMAVLVYFRREIAEMLAATPFLFRAVSAGAPATPDAAGLHRARLIWLLVVGSVPAVLVGLMFRSEIERSFRTPSVAALTLALGAILFYVAERKGSQSRSDRSLTLLEAFWIGCAQAAALIPGVSRSGATITVALFLGVRRGESARFIFLLAIPAILGAAVSEAPDLIVAGLGDTVTVAAIGLVISGIVGYVTVKYFIRYLANHSLDLFAWYRLALAGAVVVWSF
jgi:undecaprenyl-diphosphatase